MKNIDEIINYRRAVRVYDENADYNPEITKKCIERATLAPSSSNMQLWEFYKVSTEEKKQKITTFCLGQSAARTANELLIIVVRKDLWKKRAQWNHDTIKKSFGEKLSENYTKREKRGLSYYSKLMPFVYAEFLGVFGCLKYAFSWSVGLFKPMYRQTRNSDMRIVAHKSAALAAQTFMLSMAAEGYDTCPMEGIDTLRIKKLLKLPMSAEINMVISCGIRKPEGVYSERIRVPFEEVYFEV